MAAANPRKLEQQRSLHTGRQGRRVIEPSDDRRHAASQAHVSECYRAEVYELVVCRSKEVAYQPVGVPGAESSHFRVDIPQCTADIGLILVLRQECSERIHAGVPDEVWPLVVCVSAPAHHSCEGCRHWARQLAPFVPVELGFEEYRIALQPPDQGTCISGCPKATHGALTANPVREVKIRATSKKRLPRALEAEEREQWFELLRQDEQAVKADLIDLSKFMMATGERIGESLAVTWQDLNRETGDIDCSHQIQRITGKGLVRRRVKSAAGDRIIGLPPWALEMLLTRWTPGTPLDAPIFPDSTGGFRDTHNVQKALRNARRPIGGQRRQQLGVMLRTYRRDAGFTQNQVVAKLGWRKTRISLIETGRVRLAPDEAVILADTYSLSRTDRAALLELTELASMRSLADELEWVTAHAFRKTTATILESAGQTPREVADQLGHAQTSTTVDDYFGRRRRNPGAAQHLEDALRHIHEKDRETSAGPEL